MAEKQRRAEVLLYIFLGGFLGFLVALFVLHLIYHLGADEPSPEMAAKIDLIAFFQARLELWLSAVAMVISLILLGAFSAIVLFVRNNLKEAAKRIGILEDLDRTRTEFIWMASHQLQTPLTALKWSIKMFLAGDFGRLENKEQQGVLEKDLASTERLVLLVAELLSVARIESKRLELNLKSVSLREFQEGIKQVVTNLEVLANQKNLSLVFESLAPRSIYFDVDLAKIQQVIQILLENAIWYTPPGKKIKVEIALLKNEVSVRVIDEGIGISREDHPKVFSKFFRANNARRVKSGGTGLGLYLGKILVEGHGGRIWFVSQEGKGSTFGFNLPLKIGKAPEEFLRKL